jgi:hypothetical protein
MPRNYMDTPPALTPGSAFTWVGFMVAIMATLPLAIVLMHHPFQVQIVALWGDTVFASFFVFCDSKAWHGYALRDGRVRSELPSLVVIHLAVLASIFLALTLLLTARPLLPGWMIGESRSGTRSGQSPFDIVLIFVGFAIMWAEVLYFRRRLRRALNPNNANNSATPRP